MAEELLVFISHSSADSTLASRLIDLVEKSLKLPARQIRCTSVNGYRLPVGADTDEQLRREIFVARAFIGLITPSSSKSSYVLFELGARWGAKRHLAPLLARGADVSFLGGPLAALNALDLADRAQVFQLVEDLGEYLEISLEPMAAFEAAVNAVVAEAKTLVVTLSVPASEQQLDVSKDELRVLQFFAAHEDPTAKEIATHLRVPEQKARFFIDSLYEKNMIGQGGTSNRGFTWYLKQAGRVALVNNGLL